MAAPDTSRRGLGNRLKTLPEGAVLKHGFLGLLALSVVMIGLDFRALVDEQAAARPDLPALSPVRMDRPHSGSQIRRYLPKTRPVAPDADLKRLAQRPRGDSEAEPMRFRLGTKGAAFAEGTITPGTADALKAFLAGDRAGNVSEIVLHSPGGSVADAVQMAQMIRDNGLSTRIIADGYCASSCPLVFAGGVARVADATAWIGVHQAFPLDTAFGSLADGMEQAQRIGAEAQRLLDEFGVDPLVWTHAMSTPREKLYLFTTDELIALKLATEVEGTKEQS